MSRQAVLLLTVGFMSIFKLALVGVLTASEFLFIIAFPFVCVRAIKFVSNYKTLKKVFFFWFIYLMSQILSDLIRQTPAIDYQRGWAKIAILGLNLIMIAYISRLQLKNLIWYFWGSALGTLFDVVVLRGDIIYNWKFILGPSVSILVSLLLYKSNFPRATKGFLFIILGMIHIFLNCRSLGGMTMLSGLIFLLPEDVTSKVTFKEVFKLKYVVLIFLAISAIYSFYIYGVTNGYFGEEAREKYIGQTSNGKNIILGARSEIASSIVAIADSPLIGHGSWAKDRNLVMVFLEFYGAEEDDYGSQEMLRLGIIPTHSHLFGAWVEAGLLGFVFWIIIFKYAFSSLFTYIRLNKIPYRLTYIFTLFIFSWDVFFSPFDTERRMSNAVVIILCLISIAIMDQLRSRKLTKIQAIPHEPEHVINLAV